MSSGVGTVEAPQQELVNLKLEEALQQTIDIERFEAVPEHDSNLQRLIERYGDNRGSCPYIKSMGEAGVQLVQKLVEAEKNPDRGPTIRELMEAKKKEAQSQTIVTEKPEPSKDLDAVSTTKTKQELGKKPAERIHPDKTDKHVLAHEYTVRITSEAAEIPAKLVTSSGIEAAVAQRVKTAEKSRRDKVIAAESALRQQPFDVDARRVAEIEQIQKQTLSIIETMTSPAIPNVTAVEKEAKPVDNIPQDKIDDPVPEIIAEESAAVIADEAKSNLVAGQVIVDSYMYVETAVAEDHTFDIDEIMAEIGLNHAFTDSDISEKPVLTVETDADIEVEEFELNTETLFDKTRLDLAPDEVDNTRKRTTELTNTTEEVEEPPDLIVELNAYIKTLEPIKSEAAEIAFKSLVEALEASHKNTDNNSESSNIEAREIKHLFVELLEALDLDYEDETVKILIQELFTQELLAEITEGYELSVNQLDYLGTHEYKPASITSLLTSLVQMIKQKVKAHLQLGKYALSVSLA